jgi:transposase-like protein
MTGDSSSLTLARCPLCHTSATLSGKAVAAGEHWRCGTCGQSWTAQRLATVAAYEAWVASRSESPGSSRLRVE